MQEKHGIASTITPRVTRVRRITGIPIMNFTLPVTVPWRRGTATTIFNQDWAAVPTRIRETLGETMCQTTRLWRFRLVLQRPALRSTPRHIAPATLPTQRNYPVFARHLTACTNSAAFATRWRPSVTQYLADRSYISTRRPGLNLGEKREQ